MPEPVRSVRSVRSVQSWSEDFDLFDAEYVNDPFPIWDGLREACPIAHSDRYGGSWLPTTYEDVTMMARDPGHFSSRTVAVIEPPAEEQAVLAAGVPPISSDVPEHTWARRLLLPWFAPGRVGEHEPATRALCRSLAQGIAAQGHGDAAADYAQQIPVRVIGRVLAVPDDMADTFTGWVRDILEFAHIPERRNAGRNALVGFIAGVMAERKEQPGDDLISALLHAEVDGEPVSDAHVLGTAALTLVAGVDTTWSAIGASLWHLATHDDDRRRLVAEPELLPIAIEEFLRAYSPVTMGRIVTEDIDVGGCPMKEGDRVLLNFPAANRDPAQFEQSNEVIIDRMQNRHVAFGAGIHRCAGSNLARMEVRVALEEWLEVMPEFRLADDAEVTWAGGQVRGPRSIPVVVA